MRDNLALAAGKAKLIGVVDHAIRYNPLFRHRVQSVVQSVRTASAPQRRAIIKTLTHRIIAQAHLTRYGSNFGDDLATWPVLTKAQLRDDPDAFLVAGLARVPAATAGTTGVPLLLHRSLRSIAAEQVFLDDLLAPHGLRWDQVRVAVLRGDAITPAVADESCRYGRLSHRGRRLTLSSLHLNADSLDWYWDRLRAFQPAILYVYATTAANLLRLLIQSRRRLHVPLVVASSERLDVGLYHAIEEHLGAKVIDYYGMAERSVLATRQSPQEWSFDPAYGNVELVASPEDPVVDGQRHVPIVATGFWTDAQPLIRYDTGDRAVIPAGAGADECAAIAAGEAPFLGIAGRADEFLVAPDGLRLAGLNQLPREVRHLLQLQIVQETPQHVTLRVLAAPDFCRDDRERLMANARKKIPAAVRVEIGVVEHLEMLPSGKTPFVIRRIPSASAVTLT